MVVGYKLFRCYLCLATRGLCNDTVDYTERKRRRRRREKEQKESDLFRGETSVAFVEGIGDVGNGHRGYKVITTTEVDGATWVWSI